MNNVFEVGDLVMMLDGPEESKKIGRKDCSLWNESYMRKLVGQVGVVRFVGVYAHGCKYIVTFPKDVDKFGFQWYCYAEWLSEVQTLTESDELDAMFDDLGGAE